MMSLERVAAFLKRQSKGWLLIWAIALVVVVGIFDYLTGYEVAFYPFYAIPILLVVWFGDRKMAIAISILSAIAWMWADVASNHVYSREWLRFWEFIVRMMFFCLVVLAGAAFKQQRDANLAQIELLERSRRLEQEIINVSDQERQRIGRDLHDGLCQYLAAIGFTADVLKQDLQDESHARAATARDISELLHEAVVRARDVARGLSPVDRDEGGLESALEDLASSTSKLMGISCDFICPEPVHIENNQSAVHLFRIAQEALNNAVKHGHAKSVVIALERNGETVSLRVSDEGVGLDPAMTKRGGMGLNTMNYRARVLGGRLEIHPNTPTGVVVTCTVDMDSQITSANGANGAQHPSHS